MDADGFIMRCKARFVPKGFQQVLGVDINDTRPLFNRMSISRAVLALAANRDYTIYQETSNRRFYR